LLAQRCPRLEFLLQPNDCVISNETGELSWMSSSIQMTTHTQMMGGGGFFGALRAWPAAAASL
jgi:uncharacterized protein (AIM24 family)